MLAVPLAVILARYRFPGSALIAVLGVLPLVMPPFVGAVALQLIFGKNGSVNLLLDDPIAGRNGLLQRAALDLFVDFAQHMLLVDGLDQPDLQLVGGERFDQIVIGRQFR